LNNEELLQVLMIQKILSVEGVVRLTFLDIGNETIDIYQSWLRLRPAC
jgi:hypothetical protein